MGKKKLIGHFDLPLLVSVLFLTVFGLIMIYNASVVIAERDFADKYHYFHDQAVWVGLGICLMFLVSFIEYHFWQRIALPLLVATIGLLLLVFVPGIGITALGASRWINLGFFVVQPAELAKLSLVVYLAAWLSEKEKGRFFAFILLLALFMGLVILEPDMGTSIILAASGTFLYFLSGAPFSHFLFLIPPSMLSFFILVKIAPYRLERFLTFLDQERDPLGASYHIRQTLFALGNGGLTGVGLGKSFQKYAYLPESTTDSIFAIIAEELGFIGSLFVISVLFFVIVRGFMIAAKAGDTFGKLLAGGIASLLGIQIIINLSAQVVLLPFTGIPLPFISYGGSSLIITLISIGILLSIARSQK